MKSSLVYLSFLFLLVHFVAIYANDDDSDTDIRDDSGNSSEEHGRNWCRKVKCPRGCELVKYPHHRRCPYCRPIISKKLLDLRAHVTKSRYLFLQLDQHPPDTLVRLQVRFFLRFRIFVHMQLYICVH